MQIYVYGGILMGFLVFAFLAGKEKSYEKYGKDPFTKMAGCLYRSYRRLRAAGRFPQLLGEDAVRGDLASLYPSGQFAPQETKYHIRRLRIFLLVIFAGDLLAAASYIAADSNMILQNNTDLPRDVAGGEDREVELQAEIISDETAEPVAQGSYSLTVKARKLNSEQIEALARSLSEELPSLIVGENEDLQHVNRQLILPSQADGYPFRISWESSSYALVDTDGTVNSDGIEDGEKVAVTLTAVLSYDDGTADGFRQEIEIPLKLIRRKLQKEEALTEEIHAALKKADEQSASQDHMTLPQKAGDLFITWTQKPADESLAVLIAASFAAAVLTAAANSRLHQTVRDRARQMALDYPQIISKFVLYMGAGQSVRNIFVKLGKDYREQRQKGGVQRGAYEEILLICRELDSGIPETEAYEHFGARCRSRQYTRLCTLLVQNLKKGNQELLSALQEEAKNSFEERRNTARELGEEAETKLLFPMVIMLAITMVIIIIPAYYSFAA